MLSVSSLERSTFSLLWCFIGRIGWCVLGVCVLLWRMWFNLFLTVLDVVQYKSFEWPLCSIVIGCEHWMLCTPWQMCVWTIAQLCMYCIYVSQHYAQFIHSIKDYIFLVNSCRCIIGVHRGYNATAAKILSILHGIRFVADVPSTPVFLLFWTPSLAQCHMAVLFSAHAAAITSTSPIPGFYLGCTHSK
jgi:hypothetical protein